MRLRLLGCGLVIVALAAACGSSGPDDPQTALDGNFIIANPYAAASGFHAGLSLRVDGSTVTGLGWLSGLQNPLTQLGVTGQFRDPDFSLALTSGNTAVGTIAGTATAAGVQGTMIMVQGTAPVSVTLQPVDTGAAGRYTSTLTGSVLEQPAAAAGAGVSNNFFSLVFAYPGREVPLLTIGRAGGRLAAGLYPIGGPTGFTGTLTPGSGVLFTVTSGELRVDVSTPYAFVGELILQAAEPGTNNTIGMTALFSAGCATQACP
jgi:hypothetical protein